MTIGAILSSVALYLAAILCGLAAGVVVNTLADRVAPTLPSPTGGGVAGEARWRKASGVASAAAPTLPSPTGGGSQGETGGDSERPDTVNSSNGARRHLASPATPPPVGEGRVGAVRRRATPLVLGALFPLLLAHTLATVSHAPGHLPVWAIVVAQAICVAVLAGVFVVDLEHRLIYDVAVFPLAAGLLALALGADRRALPSLALGAILAGGIFLLFYGLGFLLYRQEAMGFGDVKLAALVGLIVGWPAITTTLLATAVVGAIASLLLLAFSDISRRAFIPFGVFLAVGAVVALLATPPVW